MKRGYLEIPQELFKKLLSIPEECKIYALTVEPKTAAIQVYFYSESAPDLPETVSAPYFIQERKKI